MSGKKFKFIKKRYIVFFIVTLFLLGFLAISVNNLKQMENSKNNENNNQNPLDDIITDDSSLKIDAEENLSNVKLNVKKTLTIESVSKGFAFLAKSLKCDILPVGISGAKKEERGHFKNKLTIKIGEPIPYNENIEETLVFRVMLEEKLFRLLVLQDDVLVLVQLLLYILDM